MLFEEWVRAEPGWEVVAPVVQNRKSVLADAGTDFCFISTAQFAPWFAQHVQLPLMMNAQPGSLMDKLFSGIPNGANIFDPARAAYVSSDPKSGAGQIVAVAALGVALAGLALSFTAD